MGLESAERGYPPIDRDAYRDAGVSELARIAIQRAASPALIRS